MFSSLLVNLDPRFMDWVHVVGAGAIATDLPNFGSHATKIDFRELYPIGVILATSPLVRRMLT
ncbi:MAG: hypothetical protein WCJ42_10510 [Actinomycetes bacterium]